MCVCVCVCVLLCICIPVCVYTQVYRLYVLLCIHIQINTAKYAILRGIL